MVYLYSLWVMMRKLKNKLYFNLQTPPGHAGLIFGFLIQPKFIIPLYILQPTQTPSDVSSQSKVKHVTQMVNGTMPFKLKINITNNMIPARPNPKLQANFF